MTDLKPARPELLALAAKVRSDDWARQLDGALSAAATNGWNWQRAGTYACRLIFDADAEPRDMLTAAKNPLEQPRAVPPSAGTIASAKAAARSGARGLRLPETELEAAQEQLAESRRERHAELDNLGGAS